MLSYSDAVKWVALPLYERLKGTRVLEYLREFEDSQYRDREWLEKDQWRKIENMLSHAFENSPFYRRRLGEIGATPEDIRNRDDFRRIPPLTKEDLRNHLEDLRARNIPDSQVHKSTTGGSTAGFTPFYRDNRCVEFRTAGTMRHDRWCGWDVGDKETVYWVAMIDFSHKKTWKSRARNLLLDRRLMIEAHSLTPEHLAGHRKSIARFGPALIRAFPSPLSLLAQFIKENPQGEKIRPRAVKSCGEPLLPHQRELFQEVFQCPVFNVYLSRETGTIAAECEAHDKLHINMESLYLEFERNGKPVDCGEPGEILVTDLYNYGMPFIRYRIGDMGIPLEGTCPCGRSLPILDQVSGRVSDFVVSPVDGSLIPGAAFLVPLAYAPEVGEVQVIQDRIDHLEVRIVRSANFHEEGLHRFQQDIRTKFKGLMQFDILYVDEIPHEKSGKYRFLISKVDPHGKAAEFRESTNPAREA